MQTEMMENSVRNHKRGKSIRQLLGLVLLTLAMCVGLIAGVLYKGDKQDSLAVEAEAAITATRYLVEIDTCNSSYASTSANPKVKFEYTDSTGETHTTEEYDVRTGTREFYTHLFYYEDAYAATLADESLNAGKVAYFFIAASDLDMVTSATFSIDGDDDWQFERFAIYEFNEEYTFSSMSLDSSTGKYSIYHMKCDTNQSKEIYFSNNYRLTGLSAIADISALEDYNPDTDSKSETSAGFYITKSRPKTISFYGKATTNENTWDRDATKNNMTKEQACSGLPFTDTYYKYKVVVHVAGESDSTDDTGSANYFYFQLEFANGKRSAYVQANQQLTSDSFQAGADPAFYIEVNQDYGAVKAIRIIPENSTETGDPYDKMKIDSIDIYNTSSQGVVSVWTINDIGWIGIDYTDGVSTSHDENEIVRRFAVSSVDSALTLQFAITTAVSNYNIGQMQGTLLGKLYYIDSNTGEEVSTDYEDIVAKIKDFNGDTTHNKDASGYEKGRGLLFDGGKTVRFLWNLKDVKQITRLELRVYDESGAYWNIADIGVSLVGDGDVSNKTLSMNGEYMLEDVELYPIASIDFDQNPTLRYDSAYQLYAGIFSVVDGNIPFKSSVKDLSSLVGSSSTMYTISNDDESGSDTLSIIAVCDAGNTTDGLTLRATINYRNSYGTVVPAAANMQYVGVVDGKLLYKIDNLSVSDFVSLSGNGAITLKASGVKQFLVKSLILQHVRGGVLQNTYQCTYGGSVNVCKGVSTGSTTVLQDATQHQVIYVELGENTSEAILDSESYDLAVDLNYKDSLTGATLKSKYSFLTDNGATNLYPNTIVEFDTNFINIESIQSLDISATGGLKAEVKRYAIGVYQGDTCVGWYSYDNSETGTVVENATKKLDVQSDQRNDSTTVNELTFTFTTQSSNTEIANTGVNSAIAMKINYSVKDTSGETTIQSMFIPDINDYLVEGGFTSAKPAVVKILAKGITSANIESIELVPYDRNQMGKMTSYDTSDPYGANLTWGLSSVQIAFGDGEDHTQTGYSSSVTITLDANTVIRSDEGYQIDVKNITLRAIVSYKDLKDKTQTEKPVYNKDLDITIPYSDTGRDVTVELLMKNSDKGWTTEITDVSTYGSLTYESAQEKAGKTDKITEDTVTLTMKGNVDSDTTKKVTFTSVANKSRSVSITITMLSYKNTYGSDPLIMNVTSNTGEICKALGETAGEMKLNGANEETVTVKCSSGEGKITLKVNQTEGDPITYICTDNNDGTASIYLNGNRTAKDAVLQVTASCTDSEGNKESVTTDITVLRDSSSTTASTSSMTISYERANAKVYGVIAGEDKAVKLYVDQANNVQISYTTTDGSVLKDQTTYNDQIKTETVTTDDKKEEDADSAEGETEDETEDETETVEPETKTTVIPDAARATVGTGSLLLPSASTTYTFQFVGDIQVIHQ